MWRSYRRFFAEIEAEWPSILLSLVAMLALAVASAGYVALTGPLLKGLLQAGPLEVDLGIFGKKFLANSQHAAWVLPIGIVAVAALKGSAQAVQFTVNGGMSLRAVRRLRSRAFARLLQLSPRFYERTNTADVVARLTSDSERIEQAVFYGMMPIIRESLSIAAMLLTCVLLDPKLSLFVCLAVPLAALPLSAFAKWLKRFSRTSADQMSDLAFSVFESVSGIRTVQAFGIEDYEKSRFDASGNKHLRAMSRSYLIRGVRSPVMETLGALGIGALVYYLSQSMSAGTVDPTHVAAFAAAVILMYEPVKKLGAVGDHLAAGAAALDRVYELVDAPVEIQDTGSHGSPVSGALALDDVHFGYDDRPVLRGISLSVKPGQVCALVGRSGAGKSTLMQLLLRFYDPSKGRIRLAGIALQDWPLHTLRRHLAWVSQEVFLFNASVRENLCLGQRHPPSRIEAALRAAYAWDFVQALPQGLDTPLGERGVTLSGGQRQRLAIARAFLRDAPVLLLDEATSALDAESEQAVQQALIELMRGRTTLVIAHRLSTIRHADMIAVVDAGRIVECGTHATLKDAGGVYSALIASQRDGVLVEELA